MFGLGVRYLMGWAMAAADGARKERAEWPPHPDRIFMALAAAWFETGKEDEEGAALRWLEECGAPMMAVDLGFEERRVVTHYVPVNDQKPAKAETVRSAIEKKGVAISRLKDAGLSLLPDLRSRQPRSFPVALPHDPVVHLIWDRVIPSTHRAPLSSLCAKVTSVGHSASLVQMWMNEAPPPANLVPVSGVALHRMRVFGPGRLEYLENRYNREQHRTYANLVQQLNNAAGKEKAGLKKALQSRFPGGRPVYLRPDPGLWQGYSPTGETPGAESLGSVFDPRLVVLFFASRKRLPLNATLKITQAFRGALLKSCPEPIPEWVSGHDDQGRPSRKPHIAVLPLPFVGSRHADGRIMGLALAIPSAVDAAEADRVLGPWLRDDHGLPRPVKLFDGEWLECLVQLDTREESPYSLSAEAWTAPSCCWGSVTPVVLDRHFDGPKKWEAAAESLKDSFVRVGLPKPREVLLHPVSIFEGAPCSNEFPWMSRKGDGSRMHHAHAVVVFDRKVQGPVVVGAGRFRGYGLCRPLIEVGGAYD